MDLKKHFEEKDRWRWWKSLSIYEKIMASVAFLGLIGGAIAWLTNIGTNIWKENKQDKALKFENRPILKLDAANLVPWFVSTPGDGPAFYGGGVFTINNVGKSPATSIVEDTEWQVTSDAVPKQDLCDWRKKNQGGGCEKFVLAQGEKSAFEFHPMVAAGNLPPKLIFIGAVLTYKGPSGTDRYWSYFWRLLAVISCGEKLPPLLMELETKTDWDNNSNTPPPKLIRPDWEQRLSLPYLRQLLDKKASICNLR